MQDFHTQTLEHAVILLVAAAPGLQLSATGIALGLLPVLTFGLAAACAAQYLDAPARLRTSVLIAAVVWGAWIVAGCELLSFAGAVTFWPILLWWLVPAVALACLVWMRRSRLQGLLRPPNVPGWGHWPPLILAAILVLLAGIVAALSPPNTVDALTYHLPRQVRWMQQGSVEHYAIHNVRQIVLPPMAEFAGLHLMILSGGDFYATLIQWFALLLGAVAASLIARDLGGPPIAQSMAALLVIANPMAWLQASSAKNDVVAGLWVLILAWLTLRILRAGRCSLGSALFIGGAAGLAALTKPSAAMFALPLLIILGAWLLLHRRAAALPALAFVMAAMLLLNSGHAARNMRTFDSPTAGSTMLYRDRPHTSETFSPRAILSTASRNLALHFLSPFPALNRALDRSLGRFHRIIGADINDERTTVYGPFALSYAPRDETRVGAPLHIILFAVALVIFPFALRPRPPTLEATRHIAPPHAFLVGSLVVATIAGFLLFSLLLKWQPWHTRLHIGLLMLAAPATTVILCRGRGLGALPIAAMLCIILIPTVLWNYSRPLVGPGNIWTTPRDVMMDRYHTQETTDQVVELVRRARPAVVSVNTHMDGEYAMLRRLLRLEHAPLFAQAMASTGGRMPRPWPRSDLTISDVHTMPQFADTSSGDVNTLIARIGGYTIYAPADMAERLRESGLIPEIPH